MGVLQTVVNSIDFDLGVAAAVDAERIDAECFFRDMGMEDTRVPPASQQELEARGHFIPREGDFITPIIQAVGHDPKTGEVAPFSDPRSE